jgi:uncharacterized protein
MAPAPPRSERHPGIGRPRLAVVGSGVSGLTAAYVLQGAYDVTLFESESRLGGHAHTHDVPTADGRLIPIDTGFIVHNERTYPHLLRLFRELGVSTQDSDMSMSVRCDGCGLEYAGARGLRGFAAQPSALLRPEYVRLLAEVRKFHRQARRVLDSDECEGLTLGGFLAQGGYSTFFAQHFMMPFVSAVWSAGLGLARKYPARYLFEFFAHHGMLTVSGAPVWKTVVGGSRSYVERAAKGLSGVEVSTSVRSIRRYDDGVEIRDDMDQVRSFDRVVVASHADQALSMLENPTDDERAVLGAIHYSRNETVFHTDVSLLPRSTGARASWNYLLTECAPPDEKVHVSYHMNRLHQIHEPVDYVVTLNEPGLVKPDSVLDRMVYEHPIYTGESLAAQRRLPSLNLGRTAYAGAYHGWGFHEDGCLAGVRAAQAFGVEW